MNGKELLEIMSQDDEKFVDDAIKSAMTVTADRVNGKMDNDAYQKKMDEIKDSIELRKQQNARNAMIQNALKRKIELSRTQGTNSATTSATSV